MKRLCLLRHAKSDWGDPAKDDFDRPLNPRGEKAADFMAGYIARSPYRPDLILCSTAARASATCAPLCAALGEDVPVTYLDDLYHAMPDVMMDKIRNASDTADTLLVVGHNPGLVLLAMALAEDPDEETALRIAHGVPTGGFIVFDFDVEHWNEIGDGTGVPRFFGRPRDLMADATGEKN